MSANNKGSSNRDRCLRSLDLDIRLSCDLDPRRRPRVGE
jgi:hypothetical protein